MTGAVLTRTRDLATHGPVAGVDYHVALAYYPEAADVARWDLARWDTAAALWEGDAPFDDVTCDVISVQLDEGRDMPLERFRPGSASIELFDPDGRYSPWRTAPDPTTFGAIRVGIGVKVWAEIDGTVYPRFVGVVDSITDTFPDTGDLHNVTFQAFDVLSLLAAFDGLEQPAVGAGELPGARLGRIVTNAEYGGPTAFDAGTPTLQATTLAKNALDEMGLVTDTEVGALWADRAGVIQFRDVNGLVNDPRYTDVQAVFGDTDTGAADEICYTDLVLSSDTDKVKNIVSVANAGGTAVTRTDPTSISLFHPRTYQRFDLIHENPAWSTIVAQRHLDFYAYAANRVRSITVDMATLTDDQRAAVLALDTLWRVEVRRRAEGFQVVAELQVEGMSETVSADGWSVTFRTFAADAVFNVARWDTARWDTGLWGY